MLDFSRSKLFVIYATCLFFIVASLPNLLPEDIRASIPSWLPNKTLSLGLDLQGGSHLLLKIDTDTYFKEQFTTVRDELRGKLRTQKIGYQSLLAKDDAVEFTVLPETLPEGPSIEDMVAEIDPELSVKDMGDNAYRVNYGEEALNKKTLQVLEHSMEIVTRRVDETGTKEPNIQRQGKDRILVQVPGLHNPEQIKAILGKTAKMTFHLVNEEISPDQLTKGVVPAGTRIMAAEGRGGSDGAKVAVFNRVALSGELLTGASATYSQGQPIVSFSFNSAGARKFAEITQNNIGKRFAVVLDNKIITAPVIRSAIVGGSGIIEGNFTVESANELAILLRAGALPAPLDIVEERTVGPSLGADSVAAGQKAVLIAVAAVMLFMWFYYGLFGFFSDVAAFMNLIIIMGSLSLFGATLTLPGLAGIALTVGMAVDANTLIFERMRDEIRNGKTALAAIDNGFRVAFATILDSHITTLIAACVLFYFGSGTVKGFAVTLAIGLTSSMFTAIMLTRLMIASWYKAKRPKTLPL